ncbi:MAG TPA: GNAT family protein [candidate division Zixibacteria bacterium]|nr:GNAT family protein [candidate division Zixibacteria bacterium]
MPDVVLRKSLPKDIEHIVGIERDSANTPYIRTWSVERHLHAVNDIDHGHYIVTLDNSEEILGYAILVGLDDPEGNIEFKRLVIDSKDKGYGRAAFRKVVEMVFEELGAHRVWLDVMEHNQRGYHIYSTEGFIKEGVQREAAVVDGRRVNLITMSMLKREYWSRK